MTRPMTRVFLTLASAGVLAGTAMAQLGAPTLGYLPDSGTIRAMSGIPASGSIGPLLGSGQTFNQIVPSPGGSFALASLASGSVAVVTVASDGVTLQTAPVAGAIAGNLVLSPNGSSGLVSGGGQLQVITGLPGSPAAQAPVGVSYLGAVSALAVSDDGQWAAGVFGGSVSGTVIEACNAGGYQVIAQYRPLAADEGAVLQYAGQSIPLPALSGVAALTFFHGSDNLAVTTAIQILQISNLGGTPAVSTIYGSPNTPIPPESPIALALTADNTTILLIEPDGGIGQVVLANGAVSIAHCGCTPQGLTGLGGSVFLLSNLANGSVKLYDAASGNVWFVPLAPSGTQGGQQ